MSTNPIVTTAVGILYDRADFSKLTKLLNIDDEDSGEVSEALEQLLEENDLSDVAEVIDGFEGDWVLVYLKNYFNNVDAFGAIDLEYSITIDADLTKDIGDFKEKAYGTLFGIKEFGFHRLLQYS